VENRTKWPKTRETQSLRPFKKEFERGCKFGPNNIETGVQKFILGALQPNPKASAVILGSLAMVNML